jgi:hypothetical protein
MFWFLLKEDSSAISNIIDLVICLLISILYLLYIYFKGNTVSFAKLPCHVSNLHHTICAKSQSSMFSQVMTCVGAFDFTLHVKGWKNLKT